MRRYIARRLIWSIGTLLGASLLIFTMLRVIPGDVALLILVGDDSARGVSERQINELRHTLGLDKPLPVQYISWLGELVRLDLGTSLYTRRPVTYELKNRLPPTIQLTAVTMLLALIISFPAGILSAIWHNRSGDYAIRSIAIAGITAPNFWIGLLILLVLVIVFRWSPPLGYVNFWQSPTTNLQQIIWPALTLAFGSAAINARMLRSSMLEVLRQDYIRTARAKGLAERSVLIAHAMKNAMLPVLTIMGLQFAGLISGVVIMEKMFAVPGVGSGLFDAIVARDYPMVQSLIVLITVVVLVVNLAVDLLYGWFDPRIRYS